MRPIDADRLLKIWEERHCPNYYEDTAAYYIFLQFYWMIKDAPTITAEADRKEQKDGKTKS